MRQGIGPIEDHLDGYIPTVYSFVAHACMHATDLFSFTGCQGEVG
jgi:hypothetical protein